MKRTFGADIGYSSGKKSSNLKTPPSNGDPSGPIGYMLINHGKGKRHYDSN